MTTPTPPDRTRSKSIAKRYGSRHALYRSTRYQEEQDALDADAAREHARRQAMTEAEQIAEDEARAGMTTAEAFRRLS